MNVKTGDLAYVVNTRGLALACNVGLVVEVGAFSDWWTLHAGEPMWNVHSNGPMKGLTVDGREIQGNIYGYVCADACLRRISGPSDTVNTDTEVEKDHEMQAG